MQTDKKTPINILRAYQRCLKLQRGYSANTLDAYLRDMQKLLSYLEGEDKHLLDVQCTRHGQRFQGTFGARIAACKVQRIK